MPRGDTTADVGLKFAVFVGGFQRKLAKHFREHQWQNDLSRKLTWDLQNKATPKFPVMEKFYYLSFSCEEDVKLAVEQLSKYEGLWQDQTYGRECKIYAKRHRTYETRQIGKFRKLFYDTFEEKMKGLSIFQQNPFKLHTVRGTMFLQYKEDDIELLTFPRELLRDASSIEVHYDNWMLCKIPKVDVDNWVEQAILNSKAQEQRQV